MDSPNLIAYVSTEEFLTIEHLKNTLLVTWPELSFIGSGMELMGRWKCKGIGRLVGFGELFTSGSYTMYSLRSFMRPRQSKCEATHVIHCVHARKWNSPTSYPKGTCIFYY
jgi:hypothetical protein